MLPRILLYCTENVAGIHACIRGRGQRSLDPPENRRNIVFPGVSLVARCRHANSVPYQKSKSWTPSAKTTCPLPTSIEA